MQHGWGQGIAGHRHAGLITESFSLDIRVRAPCSHRNRWRCLSRWAIAAPTVGLAFLPFFNWFDSGELGEVLRWSQTAVELANGNPPRCRLRIWITAGGCVGMARDSPMVAGPCRMAARPQ